MPRRSIQSSQSDLAALRVIKTIRPGQDGAKRHTLKHGDALVCVRHRSEPASNTRVVTVELVVESWPIAARDNKQVTVRLGPAEKSTRALLLALDAKWDPTERVWRMPRNVARTLRLLSKIVPNPG